MPPAIILTATLENITGVDDGALRVTLLNYGNWVPRAPGVLLVKPQQVFKQQPGVQIRTPVWANDQIQPPTTYYLFEGVDSRGRVNWCMKSQLVGIGSLDLLDLAPYEPTGPPPPPF